MVISYRLGGFIPSERRQKAVRKIIHCDKTLNWVLYPVSRFHSGKKGKSRATYNNYFY